ncbi:double-strand break repair protein AddB [Geminicoccaceae bacterium 1502E]|nr:double-strand break repair protein AddB [Geminicoccaceae bacterium 1502E]
MATFTIAAHLPFLDTLVGGLLAEGRDGQLADTLLLLPSRRACLAVRDTFLRLSGGRPLLLPRMQPIGELDADELLLDPARQLALPDALPPLRRHLLLTRLVLARGKAEGEIAHEQAIRLAAELARFLDELQTEEVPLDALDRLVPEDLAEHWQRTLSFLRILSEAWPAILAEEGALDPALRRRRLLDEVAARWLAEPPGHPVIAAGVTGTIPAVARLLAAVARLDQGHVVLPALDTAMDEEAWQEVGRSPTHPQWMLHRLLGVMNVDRAAVAPWPHEAGTCGRPERARFLAEVMRPAGSSEAWQELPPPPVEALGGLIVSEAPDLVGEALQVALRLREVLETPGRTAALVTSDRNLARRVAAELGRFGIRVDDSAGVPLDQSPPGGLLLLSAHLVASGGHPVTLLSTLKHPLARGRSEQGTFRRRVRALERTLLRGPRPAGGLDGLVAQLRERQEDDRWPAPVPPDELLSWLEELCRAALPLAGLVAQGEAPFAALLEAHLAFAEWLAADEEGDPGELWAQEAGLAAHRFVNELRAAAEVLGEIPTSAYPALLAVLMGNEAVRAQRPAHPRLAVLGQLESRLARADLVVVGGLNEGVWPRIAESGPWLSRGMRTRLGLPPVEMGIGIAAHDFLMSACAPEVLLSRAAKDEGGQPTTPSRWLARLDAVLKATASAGNVAADPAWSAWSRTLDAPRGPARPVARPRPCPPRAARPRVLWATDVERLLRDPYSVYARRILGLSALDPLDADPGAAERGQLVHAAVEDFVRKWPHALPAEPLEELLRLGRERFAEQAHRPLVAAVWWPRFVQIARWFVAVERQRRLEIDAVRAELVGELVVDGPGGPVRVRARADRVEVGRDGLRVVDYKTGVLPAAEEVRNGLSPQLSIEAAIALEGGFAEVHESGVAQVMLWSLKGGEEGGALLDPALSRGREVRSAARLAEDARAGLEKLVRYFDDPAVPYVPVPRPEVAPRFSDYEHLARVAEWRGSEGGEE